MGSSRSPTWRKPRTCPEARATSPPCPARATSAPIPAPADLGDPGCDVGGPGHRFEPGMQTRPALVVSAGLGVAADGTDRQSRPGGCGSARSCASRRGIGRACAIAGESLPEGDHRPPARCRSEAHAPRGMRASSSELARRALPRDWSSAARAGARHRRGAWRSLPCRLVAIRGRSGRRRRPGPRRRGSGRGRRR